MSDRPVATDALATLGTVLDDKQKRDAIHLAVIPMVAKQIRYPGEHVAANGDLAANGCGVGIVDPFLQTPAKAGQRFWLVIYPRVITSLRHVWAHPAFPDEAGTPGIATVSSSEQWMRKWAMEHMGEDYYGEGNIPEDAAYSYAIQAGRDKHLGPYESARDYIDSEWWSHWEAITGERGDRGAYFSCAC